MQILERKDPLASLKSGLASVSTLYAGQKLKEKEQKLKDQQETKKSVVDAILKGYGSGRLTPKGGINIRDIITGTNPDFSQLEQRDIYGNVIQPTESMPAAQTMQQTSPAQNVNSQPQGNPIIERLKSMIMGGATAAGAGTRSKGLGLGQNTAGAMGGSSADALIERYYQTDDPDELAQIEEQLRALGVKFQ